MQVQLRLRPRALISKRVAVITPVRWHGRSGRDHRPRHDGCRVAGRRDLLAVLSPSTINRRLAALKMRIAKTLGLIDTVEVKGVKSERYHDARGPSLTN